MPGVNRQKVVAAFERSLILYAGDSFGASPLAARIGISSVPALYSTVAVAVGALKGSAQVTAVEAVVGIRTALGMTVALRGGQRLIETHEALAVAMYDVSGLRPTLDYLTGPAYHLMGFDTRLFTPVLVAARLPGWTAHLAGQPRAGGVIRPRAPYDDRSAGHLAGEG
jgi:citrate synthase